MHLLIVETNFHVYVLKSLRQRSLGRREKLVQRSAQKKFIRQRMKAQTDGCIS